MHKARILSKTNIVVRSVKVSFLCFYRSKIHFVAVEMLLETFSQPRTIQADIKRIETGERVKFVRLRRRASSTSSVPQRSLPNRQTKSAIDRPDTRDLTVVVDTVYLTLSATVRPKIHKIFCCRSRDAAKWENG